MPGRTAERSLETGTRVPEPSPQGAQESPPGTEQRPPHTYTVHCTRCSRLVSVGGRLGLRLALTTNTREERSGAVTRTSIDRTPLTEVRAHAASPGRFSTARFGEWPPRARGAETDRRTDLPLDVGALPSSSMLRDLAEPGRTWTSRHHRLREEPGNRTGCHRLGPHGAQHCTAHRRTPLARPRALLPG